MTSFVSEVPARRSAAVGAGAFIGAGALLILASVVRWGAACGSGLDTPACLAAQDHLLDYLLPSEPWTPVGMTAVPAGLAYLLAAAGLALVFAAARSSGWARVLQAVLVGSVFGIGMVTLLSGAAGHPVGFGWVGLPWMLGPLLMASVLVDLLSQDSGRAVLSDRAWCAWVALLVAATPMVELVLTSMLAGYSSHDTTPWDGVVSGGAFVLAGVVVLVGLVRTAARRRVTALG